MKTEEYKQTTNTQCNANILYYTLTQLPTFSPDCVCPLNTTFFSFPLPSLPSFSPPIKHTHQNENIYKTTFIFFPFTNTTQKNNNVTIFCDKREQKKWKIREIYMKRKIEYILCYCHEFLLLLQVKREIMICWTIYSFYFLSSFSLHSSCFSVFSLLFFFRCSYFCQLSLPLDFISFTFFLSVLPFSLLHKSIILFSDQSLLSLLPLLSILIPLTFAFIIASLLSLLINYFSPSFLQSLWYYISFLSFCPFPLFFSPFPSSSYLSFHILIYPQFPKSTSFL